VESPRVGGTMSIGRRSSKKKEIKKVRGKGGGGTKGNAFKDCHGKGGKWGGRQKLGATSVWLERFGRVISVGGIEDIDTVKTFIRGKGGGGQKGRDAQRVLPALYSHGGHKTKA